MCVGSVFHSGIVLQKENIKESLLLH